MNNSPPSVGIEAIFQMTGFFFCKMTNSIRMALSALQIQLETKKYNRLDLEKISRRI